MGFRFIWNTHRWTGLTLAAIFLLTAVTGLLLLWKKEFAWIQPPTQKGEPGPLTAFLDMETVLGLAVAEQHPHFSGRQDIDRIDVRLDEHVYKLRSVHDDSEMQICATTGRVLSLSTRTSDFLERLHDGSWLGDGFKVFVMPLSALGLLYLVGSGFWIWLHPRLKRRAKRRRHQAIVGNTKPGRS